MRMDLDIYRTITDSFLARRPKVMVIRRVGRKREECY
jgi:hypothetical protein